MKKLLFILILSTINTSLIAQWSWLHPVPQGNNLLRMSFINASTGWAAGEKGAIIKTVNGGNDWTIQYAGTVNDIRAFQFTDASHGWAGAESDLFYSSNSGQSWEIIYRFPGYTITAMAMQDNDTGIVAITDFFNGAKLYRTTNSGYAWTQLPVLLSTDIYDIEYLPNGNVVAAGSVGTLLHSNNGGISWTTVSAGTSDDFIDISAPVNSNVFATTANGIYKSTNGGTSYTAIGNPGAGGGFTLYAIDFANANDGVAGCDQGNLYFTTDGGQSWNYYGTSATWLNLQVVEAINSNVFFTAGTGGTILKTNDAGNTWNEMSTRLSEYRLNAAEIVNSNTYFAAGLAGTLLKTTNGGSLWTPVSSGAGGEDLNDIHFANSSIGICVGTNGTIVKSTDGGNTWNFIFTGISEQLFALARTSSGRYYTCGANGKLTYSLDDGDTWTDLPTPYTGTGYDFTEMQSFGSDSLVIATNQPYIVTTYDNGLNWNLLSTASSSPTTAMWFINAMNGWIGTSSGEVYATNDGGINWNLVFQSASSAPIGAITFADPVNGWVASGNEIFRTANGGVVWGAEISPSQDPIYDLEVTQGTNVIGVGDGLGTVIKRANEITLSMPTSVFCTDNNYTLAINANGTWNPGNIFRIELSDEFGEFIFPTELGSVVSTGTTPVLITVPNGLFDATTYRIRVFSSNPPMFSTLNSNPLEVRTSPDAYITPNGPTAFCQGSSVTLFAQYNAAWTYQWFKDGVLLTGQTADTLFVNQTGDYTVTVSDGICSLTSPLTDVLVINCTGLAENGNAGLYQLQPNPATEMIQLRPILEDKINFIEITDISGRLIDRIICNVSQSIQVPVNHLQPGAYYLRIEGEKPATLRFIKQ